MKYIYIDESGDLGDNYLGSRYFVIGAIIVDNPKNLNRIIKYARNNYNNILGRDLEIRKQDKSLCNQEDIGKD